MSGENIYFWNDLMYFIQGSVKNTTDYIIAREMISRFNQLTEMKLEQLAIYCNTSPGTISKFINKMGYSGFGVLKTQLLEQKVQKSDISAIKSNYTNDQLMDAFLIQDANLTKEVFNCLHKNSNSDRLLSVLDHSSKICLITPYYTSSAAMSFARNCKDEGVECITIDRKADEELLIDSIINSNIVIIISSTGKWLEKKKDFVSKIPMENKNVFIIGSNSLLSILGNDNNLIPIVIGDEGSILNSHFNSTRYFTLFFVYLTLHANFKQEVI